MSAWEVQNYRNTGTCKIPSTRNTLTQFPYQKKGRNSGICMKYCVRPTAKAQMLRKWWVEEQLYNSFTGNFVISDYMMCHYVVVRLWLTLLYLAAVLIQAPWEEKTQAITVLLRFWLGYYKVLISPCQVFLGARHILCSFGTFWNITNREEVNLMKDWKNILHRLYYINVAKMIRK